MLSGASGKEAHRSNMLMSIACMLPWCSWIPLQIYFVNINLYLELSRGQGFCRCREIHTPPGINLLIIHSSFIGACLPETTFKGWQWARHRPAVPGVVARRLCLPLAERPGSGQPCNFPWDWPWLILSWILTMIIWKRKASSCGGLDNISPDVVIWLVCRLRISSQV